MRNSRTIAINAILFALTIVLTVINSAVPIPGVSIAFLMLLPVLIASQVEKLSTAAFTGFVLGLSSLVCAFIFPNVMSPLFYNPLVSVLPRILIGIVSWTVFRFTNIAIDKIANLMGKKNKKKSIPPKADAPLKRKGTVRFPLVSAFSAMMGVITNTAFVLAMIWVFFNNKSFEQIVINAEFFTALISLNFVIEIAVCAVLVPPIVYAVKLVLKQPLTVNGYDYLKKLRSTISVDENTDSIDNIELKTDIEQSDCNNVNTPDNLELTEVECKENKANNENNSLKIDTKPICLPDSAVGAVPDSKING